MNNSDMEKDLQETNLENGLEAKEVQRRLAQYGYNEVPEKKVSFWARLGKRFWGIIPWMLSGQKLVFLGAI